MKLRDICIEGDVIPFKRKQDQQVPVPVPVEDTDTQRIAKDFFGEVGKTSSTIDPAGLDTRPLIKPMKRFTGKQVMQTMYKHFPKVFDFLVTGMGENTDNVLGVAKYGNKLSFSIPVARVLNQMGYDKHGDNLAAIRADKQLQSKKRQYKHFYHSQLLNVLKKIFGYWIDTIEIAGGFGSTIHITFSDQYYQDIK